MSKWCFVVAFINLLLINCERFFFGVAIRQTLNRPQNRIISVGISAITRAFEMVSIDFDSIKNIKKKSKTIFTSSFYIFILWS